MVKAGDNLMRNDAQGSLKPGFKAAIFLLSVDPDESAQLFNELSPLQAEAVALAITALPMVTDSLRHQVLLEYSSSPPEANSDPESGNRAVVTQTESAIERMVELKWLPAAGERWPKRAGNSQTGYITALRKY